MKLKLLKFVLPYLLDSYVTVVDKMLENKKFERPKGWVISRDFSNKLSNSLKDL